MKKIIFAFILLALMSLSFVAAANCYPSKNDGTRQYVGTIKSDDGSRAYIYAKAYSDTSSKKNRADVLVYFWRGKECTKTDEYFGRAGFSTYVNNDKRVCIGDLFFQYKKSSNSWPTVKISSGWCGKYSDVPIYVVVAVVPQLIKEGATVLTKWSDLLFRRVILPWPWYKLPNPVPTYL